MLSWLITHSLTALALAGVVLVLCRRAHLSPAARHALWCVVLLKLLMPPLFHWPWSMPVPRAVVNVSLPSDSMGIAPHHQASPGLAVFEEADLVRGTPQPARQPILEPVWFRSGLNLVGLAISLWALGGAIVFVSRLSQAWRLRQLLLGAKAAPAWLVSVVQEEADHLRVRPPRALFVAGLRSPVIAAWGRPLLLWPQGLREELGDDGLRAVVVHELAHVRRGDHCVGWLLQIAECVWWWHPLFWLVRRQLHVEAELACDAWVVATMPCARRAYAEALLTVCERGLAPTAALGAAGRRRDLERRLLMVMCQNKSARVSLRALLGAAALAILALPGWSQPAAEDKPAPHGVAVKERAADDARVDRDKRIKDLEDKVQGLLKELRDLRADGEKNATRGTACRSVTGDTRQPVVITTEAAPHGPAPTGWFSPREDGRMVRVWDVNTGKQVNQHVSRAIALSRATYNLPPGKVEAFTKFLNEQISAPVMEAKADKDGLTVTTTPEVQRVVAQIVHLAQSTQIEKKPAR